MLFICDAVCTACKACGFIASFSISSSSLTILILTIKRYIAIVHPFKTQMLLDRYALLFHIYWLVATLPSMLRAVWLPADDVTCLHFSTAHPWMLQLVIIMACLSLDLVIFIVILLLSISTGLALATSRHLSGRKWSRSDTSLVLRMFLQVFSDFSIWCVIATYAIVNMISDMDLTDVLLWFSMSILPLYALINPIIYTLSGAELRFYLRRFHQK